MKKSLEVSKKSKKPKENGESLKIMLVGEGGQGIQTVAKILTRAAFKNKYHASYIPNFGTEQRGGVSLSFVQVSKDTIISPKFKTADIFIIVSNRDVERSLRYIGPQTHVLYDDHLIKKASITKLQARSKNFVPINAFNLATSEFSERSFNVIILGILIGLVDPDLKEAVIDEMHAKFEKYYTKKKSLKEDNQKAFETGLRLTLPQDSKL